MGHAFSLPMSERTRLDLCFTGFDILQEFLTALIFRVPNFKQHGKLILKRPPFHCGDLLDDSFCRR